MGSLQKSEEKFTAAFAPHKGVLHQIKRRKIMVRKRSMGKDIYTRCCSCQKIRNNMGIWQDKKEFHFQPEKTIFSHSVCPACLGKLYPEFVSAFRANYY